MKKTAPQQGLFQAKTAHWLLPDQWLPLRQRETFFFTFRAPKGSFALRQGVFRFVLQFNSPRNGLDLWRIPVTARYAQQDFSSFGRLARKFEFVPFRLRMIGADYPDKNTGVFRKPCKGVVQFQNEIQTGATFVRPYDNLFAEKFFPGEILGDTQKVVFRPIDLADRGNFCFRIKRRQKGQ